MYIYVPCNLGICVFSNFVVHAFSERVEQFESVSISMNDYLHVIMPQCHY